MGVPLDDAIREFISTKIVEGRTAATIRRYESSLRKFANWAGECRVDDLTPDIYRAYIAYLQAIPSIKPVSVAIYVRELKVFSRWLEDEGHVAYSPFKPGREGKTRLKVPKYDSTMPYALSTDSFRKMLDTCDVRRPGGRRDHAILSFLWDTGVRVGELCNMTVDDVDIAAGRARVHGKARRERIVFFGPEVARSLLRYRSRLATKFIVDHEHYFLTDDFRPLSVNAVTQMIRRVAVRARVEDRVNPHSFRHAFGVNYLVAGGGIRDLQQIMGHAQVTTTEVYTHLTEDRLAEMHAKFSPMSTLRRR